MGTLKQPLLRLAFGALCAAWACMAFAPVADAQFFWWFDQPKSAQKPRVKPTLPATICRQSCRARARHPLRRMTDPTTTS